MKDKKRPVHDRIQTIAARYKKERLQHPGCVWPDVDEAASWIHDHLCQDRCTVRNMARECHIVWTDFSTRFKVAMGKWRLAYIRAHRIELAKQLFSDPDFGTWGISIGEVGLLVGYNSLSAFSKAFKAHEGISPGSTWPGRVTNGIFSKKIQLFFQAQVSLIYDLI